MLVEILSLRGAPVERRDDRYHLEEATSYYVQAEAALAASFNGRDLPRDEDGSFRIETGHQVGASELALATDDGRFVCLLQIEPRAAKLSPELWGQLLSDLEGWIAGVTVGAEGARSGSVGAQGVTAPFLAEALLPLLPALEAAARAILLQPRQSERERLLDRRLRECRRVDASTIAWVSRHPEISIWLDGWRSCEALGAPPTLPVHVALPTLKHPANRYVVWLCRRVIAQLEAVSAALLAVSRRIGDLEWRTSRAERAAEAARRLRRLVRNSWLRSVPSAPPSEAAFLVVANDPRYGRLHRLARRFIAPMFRLDGDPDDPSAAVRPSYSIYEIWCFFALQRALQRELPQWRWSFSRLDTILDITGTGEQARAIATSGDHTLTLELNPTFRSLYNHRSDKRYSLSGERRPDFVLTLDGDGPSRWIVLDAKYRAGRENLQDAMKSLHIYRDSLVDEERMGRARAGTLLAPQACDAVPAWSNGAWQEKWGLGLIALAPRGDHREVAAWALKTLASSSVLSSPGEASPTPI